MLTKACLLIVLVSMISVEMGAGLKCYVGSDGVKKETECSSETKNCKTYTTCEYSTTERISKYLPRPQHIQVSELHLIT